MDHHNIRLERDTMGKVAVPADRYWGAQTQRSLENFPVGGERMPVEMIRAFAVLKQAAAQANYSLGVLDERRRDIICAVCGEISSGALDEHFPLVVWQTGSGTQTNMNVNEVVANRGNALAGERLLHPNDHVNLSQSSNDTFPTAMHIAAAQSVTQRVLPAARSLIEALSCLEEANKGVVKIGRTHLQDAVPIRFSQEISGWRGMVERDCLLLEAALPSLMELALGGTAVGTGLNAPEHFAERSAQEAARLTGLPYVSAQNKFQALTSKSALVFAHGALKALAADLMKLANDVRWMASGPRCGLAEIRIPENEPGSSIMPGKVNPTQCEMLTMVAVQVMANDQAVSMAASQGNFELNVFMPVCIYDFLQSARLLSDAMDSFRIRCISGITADRAQMRGYMDRSLMLAAALNPYIGYDNAAKTTKKAFAESLTLKEACVALGFLTAEQFDQVFRPDEMAGS